MSKFPADFHIKHSSLRRNHQIRRILLLLLVIVMLLFTGMVINGRVMGQEQMEQAQELTSSTSIIDHDPTATLTIQNEFASQSQSATPSADNFDSAIDSKGSSNIQPPHEVTITSVPTSTVESHHTPTTFFQDELSRGGGTLFLSIDEFGHKHVFAYHPQTLPFTRLTNGKWDDITPSISLDGARLAFASNRDGYWDIYVLDIASGQTTRVTETPEYDGAPSWSPDGHWLVYESYTSNLSDALDPPSSETVPNMEIYIRQVDVDNPGNAEPIRLTNHPGADYAPAWSPTGRKISFVSTRSGDSDIWLADLDQVEDRFQNISQNPVSIDTYPVWSPDGNSLAWASTAGGYQNIYIDNIVDEQSLPRLVGTGDRPVWSPSGDSLITSLPTPNRTYLTGYMTESPGLALPPLVLAGSIAGMTWGPSSLPHPLPASLVQTAEATPTADWHTALSTTEGVPGGRHGVVLIPDVDIAYPMLQDMVDESYIALREALAARIGWDYLSTLENAYVPLTSPLSPGQLEDWLYTGRAFTLNTVVLNAGWMVVMREDFGSETYWRIYLRTRFQDGSQGMPIHDLPWDLTARYSGDPRYYEQGGARTNSIPPGYWLDFTRLAASYGWERLPALSTWRAALPSARYNEFVLTDGLDWQSAMLEIYPPEAFTTPTTVNSPSDTTSVR